MNIQDLLAYRRRLLKKRRNLEAGRILHAVELIRLGRTSEAEVFLHTFGIDFRPTVSASFPKLVNFNRKGFHEPRAISWKEFPAHMRAV